MHPPAVLRRTLTVTITPVTFASVAAAPDTGQPASQPASHDRAPVGGCQVGGWEPARSVERGPLWSSEALSPPARTACFSHPVRTGQRGTWTAA